MALEKTTHDAQAALALYCRDGELREIEGSLEDRLPHYRRLVFNVVKNALATAYPITSQKYIPEEWDELVFRFFKIHPCVDPQIWKMPHELVGYIEEHEKELTEEYPAVIDLLRFEWQEVYLFMMPDIAISDHSGVCPDLHDIPVLEPEMQMLVLSYPVHTTAPSKLKNSQVGQYISLAWRERSSGKVRFMNVSTFYALLLESLSSENCTIEEAGHRTAVQLGMANADGWKEKTREFISHLHSKGLAFKP